MGGGADPDGYGYIHEAWMGARGTKHGGCDEVVDSAKVLSCEGKGRGRGGMGKGEWGERKGE